MTKRALIVDDSKTARLVLSGKLSSYGIAVDSLESAASAIDYLYENTPDAIFMDYEMPGMDGFQALKVIKSNPDTAIIPVMMYTSKEGGLAVTQARALGAFGVLPKELEPQDLEQILHSLHLMPEQESLVQSLKDLQLTDEAAPVDTNDDTRPVGDLVQQNLESTSPVNMPRDRLQQAGSGVNSIKRFVRREQRESEERLEEMLGRHATTLQAGLFELKAEQEELGNLAKRGQLLGLLSLLLLFAGSILVYYFMTFSPSSPENISSSQRQFSEEIIGLINKQGEEVELLAGYLNLAGYNYQTETLSSIPINLVEWAANQGAGFNYGERPFDDQRALWISELVAKLKEAGFRGAIELRASYGNFCLEKSNTGELSIAKEDLDINNCTFSADIDQSNKSVNDQSVAFANYLNVEMERNDGEIEILLFTSGFDEPLISYPALYNVKTAGEWNRFAVKNQRIRVSLFANNRP